MEPEDFTSLSDAKLKIGLQVADPLNLISSMGSDEEELEMAVEEEEEREAIKDNTERTPTHPRSQNPTTTWG